MKKRKKTVTKMFPSGEMRDIIFGLSTEDYAIEEEGDWIADFKYECITTIFSEKATGKCYQISDGRSGSHYSYYTYDSEDWGPEVECTEVEPMEVTTTKWVTVCHADAEG